MLTLTIENSEMENRLLEFMKIKKVKLEEVIIQALNEFIYISKLDYKNQRIERKKRALLDFVGEFGEGKEFSKFSHQEIKARIYE